MQSLAFPWRLWCATALIAFTFFGFTLTSAVPVWIDESFIVEYGRVTLAGDTDVFGFHQRSDANRPMYLYTVLGSVLQELAYRATAPSNLGPRVSALLGQLAAFGYLLYYFRLRGVNDRFSLLLGLAFLIDPLCDIGWRGGRVDSWAFAFLFASLCGIRIGSQWSVFWGGVAAAAGLLCWPSFAMLTPLIVLELAACVKQQRRFVLPIGLFAAGGAIAASAMIAPFYRQFAYGLADAGLMTAIQSQMNRGLEIPAQLRALGISFAQTPIVVIAGLCALGRRRNLPLLAGFLVALAFAFSTNLYRLRVLYLLPYLYLALASLFYEQHKHRAATWAVGLMLFAGAGFTVAGTTLSGLSNRSGKNPLDLIEPARAAIGGGSVRVYMEEPDLYFVGRTLGWKQFYCFDSCWGPGITKPLFQQLLSDGDIAVFRGEPDALRREILEKLEYRFETVILPDGGHQSSLFGWNYGPRSYGPYYIYHHFRR